MVAKCATRPPACSAPLLQTLQHIFLARSDSGLRRFLGSANRNLSLTVNSPNEEWVRQAHLFIEYGASGSGMDPRHRREGEVYPLDAPRDLAVAVEHIFPAPAGRELADSLRARASAPGAPCTPK
jgi:hypothetical protein